MSLIKFFLTPSVSISPPPPIRSLAFSSDGRQIAVGYDNGYIEIYSTEYVLEIILILVKLNIHLIQINVKG